MPTGYDLNVTKYETTEEIVLKSGEEEASEEDYVAQIGNQKYTTIQKAIDAVPSNNVETEIVLLKDVYTGENNVIPENKNVVINQKNHMIKSYNTETCFTNNGTFTLMDYTDTITVYNIT